MKIAIQDTFQGKRAGSKYVTLFWIGKDFFAETGCIRLEFLDENGNYLDHFDNHVVMSDYFATGETKEQRADALLLQHGIIKEEPGVI